MTAQELHRIEDEARESRLYGRRRHSLEERAKYRRRRLRLAFAPLALVGLAVCGVEITQPNPEDAKTILSALLVVPFLSTFDIVL